MATVNIDKGFVGGGRAIFTVHNGKGCWYTYRIERQEDSDRFRCRVLAGRENADSKSYARLCDVDVVNGTVHTPPPHCAKCGDAAMVRRTRGRDGAPFYGCRRYPACRHTIKVYAHEQQALRALRFALDCIWGRIDATRFEGAEVLDVGRCCRCGRLLTTPESVLRKIGPECEGREASRPTRTAPPLYGPDSDRR